MPAGVATALDKGETIKSHDELFAQDEKDAVWLKDVGANRWVVLSQDARITKNPLELQALLGADVAFFGVGSRNAPASDVAQILVRALPVIRRALRRFRLRWADGKRCDPPHRLQVKFRNEGRA